ncbi:MAG: HAD family hydrolase [Brevinematia bacterium]
MSYRKPILLLYDIDGTLVKLDKTGRLVYQKALCEVLNKDITLDHIDWIGTTDIEVIYKILKDNYIDDKEISIKMSEVFKRISTLFKNIIEETPEKILTLPNAYEVVEYTYKNYYNCLLTGNIKEVAYMKLKPSKIDTFFHVGAFGDEEKEREKLVPIAIKRAQKYYKTKFNNFFIIGDSHRDIIAAKKNKIKSIVVTTGKMSREELEKFEPDFIIDNLKDIITILDRFIS